MSQATDDTFTVAQKSKPKPLDKNEKKTVSLRVICRMWIAAFVDTLLTCDTQ